MSNSTSFFDQLKEKAVQGLTYFFSFLGGAAVAFQNYLAISDLFHGIVRIGALTKTGLAILFHSVAAVLGVACGGFVNFVINVELLDSFFERITGKKWCKLYFQNMPKDEKQHIKSDQNHLYLYLENEENNNKKYFYFLQDQNEKKFWIEMDENNEQIARKKILKKTADSNHTKPAAPVLDTVDTIKYWLGTLVFVATGIIFGLTAFAVAATGPLAILAILTGIFLAWIIVAQEVETWLASFDNEEENKKTMLARLKEWWQELTTEKAIGLLIAIVNVIALNLLFTAGVVSFLTLSWIGTPVLPALIIGLCLSFTCGTFTELFFYKTFLPDFCGKWKEKLHNFWQAKFSPLGLFVSLANAFANGALVCFGIKTLAILFATAIGIAAPPVGIVIAACVLLGVAAGLASFILGLAFWTGNINKICDWCKNKAQSLRQFFGFAKKEENTTDCDRMPKRMPERKSTEQLSQSFSQPTILSKPTSLTNNLHQPSANSRGFFDKWCCSFQNSDTVMENNQQYGATG